MNPALLEQAADALDRNTEELKRLIRRVRIVIKDDFGAVKVRSIVSV